jgi:hypothetical protein
MRLRLAALKGIAALFATSIAMTGASYADTFNFTSCHISDGTDSGNLACPAPGTVFGTVTLTASGSSVLFDVVLNFGSRFVETGAGGDMLFAFTDNVAGSTITNITATLGGVTVSVPAGGLSGSTNLAPFQADGTGNFTAGVFCTVPSQCNGGSTPTFDDLHFTVTNATIAQLTTANAKGNIFIADILCGSNEALTACNGLTGPVDVSSVPGPVVGAGLPGLIAAASGLIALARRRRQKLV